jgi:hypothetical protein
MSTAERIAWGLLSLIGLRWRGTPEDQKKRKASPAAKENVITQSPALPIELTQLFAFGLGASSHRFTNSSWPFVACAMTKQPGKLLQIDSMSDAGSRSWRKRRKPKN